MELINRKNIFFVLATRFPTEKAYGVTTEYSAQAVKNLGHEASIVTPFLDSRLKSGLEIYQTGKTLRRILLSERFSLGIGMRFVLFKVIYSLLVRRLEVSPHTLFWTRDLLIGFILALGGKRKVICEIHRTPTGGNSLLLRSLAQMRNVLLCPISSFLEERFPGKFPQIAIAGMAVQEQDLCDADSIGSRKKTIVYMGNPSSSGIPLDLDFLNKAAIWLNRSHRDWNLQVIGIDRDQFERKCTLALSENIDIVGYIKRDVALKLVGSASIGLVVYPDDTYFRDSFPIKIIEYAAKGLAIVASDTTAHRRILSSEQCEFYAWNSGEALSLALQKLIQDSQRRESLGRNSRAWAEKNTYEARVSHVLDAARIVWNSL